MQVFTSTWMNCDSEADETSGADKKCVTFTSYYAAVLPQIHAPFSSLDFNELSLLQLGEDRVRVHIPHSVQTHKTLTSSLCGALQGCSMPL